MAQHGRRRPRHRLSRSVEPRRCRRPASPSSTIRRIENPGFPPYRPRVADLDPAKDRAERAPGLAGCSCVSIVGSIFAIVAYIVFPIVPGRPRIGAAEQHSSSASASRSALLGIGFGAVHWSKTLMDGHDLVELRHPTRGSRGDPRKRRRDLHARQRGVRLQAPQAHPQHASSARSSSRPLPAVVLFRDLAPGRRPGAAAQAHACGRRARASPATPTARPIKASDVTLGSVFHVIPEGLNELDDKLEEKAKAAVLLMRLDPDDLNVRRSARTGTTDGIVAYSKICTHVGCPVALYEQQTHHLLCPCHQSQFDITHEAAVIFGPAKRPLPQLPITVDDEGYLVAQSDFHEPVGPSFWERSVTVETTTTVNARPPTTVPPGRGHALHQRGGELHRRAHQHLRPRQGARPQDLPRPLVVHARRGRALQLRRHPALAAPS